MNEKLQVFTEKDADLSLLEGKTIAFVGYGNQGRSQALNMRDHQLNVIIGNIDDEYKVRAQKDGFPVFSIDEACQRADFIFILIPDEIMSEVYQSKIAPNLKKHDTIVFAHGYDIAFRYIKPHKELDVVLLAPRMIGIGVRECFLNREGYFSFIAVNQNASGHANEKVLALAKAIGSLIKGGLSTTFQDETFLDLFTEQGFAPANSAIMMKPIDILKDFGVPIEAILIELILSGKMKHSFDAMRNFGIINQINLLDSRTQYGVLSRGIRYHSIMKKIVHIQEDILSHIENGGFAKEWEKKWSRIKLAVIKFFATRVSFGKMESKVRKNFKIPEVDLWEEKPYPTIDEIREKESIKKQLEDFDRFTDF